jgi:hypothetical protein
LVSNRSTKKSRGLPLCFLVKFFFYGSFTTGRERTQEDSVLIFLWSPFFTLG